MNYMRSNKTLTHKILKPKNCTQFGDNWPTFKFGKLVWIFAGIGWYFSGIALYCCHPQLTDISHGRHFAHRQIAHRQIAGDDYDQTNCTNGYHLLPKVTICCQKLPFVANRDNTSPGTKCRLTEPGQYVSRDKMSPYRTGTICLLGQNVAHLNSKIKGT